MKNLIFNDYGIEIFKDGEQYSLRYDAGELVGRMEEILISEEDAVRAQKSGQESYQVIIKYQNIEMFGAE